MKKIALVLLAMLLVLSACTSGGGSSDTIKIGAYSPLTGANAAGGELEAKGYKLAHKLYGEVLGKEIELIVMDNKSDKVEAANCATKLVEQEKVVAVVGSWSSSLSMAGGPIFKEAKVPAVGSSVTNPMVTEGNEYYFRVTFIDPFQGTVMSNYVVNTLGAKTVAIVKEVSSDYSIGLANYFVENFVALTGSRDGVVAELDYNTGDQDFSAQVTAVKAANPDAIFAPGNCNEAALFIKQARAQGITCPILGGDTYETPDFLSIGGADVEGVIFSSFFDAENPVTAESTKFIDAYREEYNEEPSANSGLGYDAYLIIYRAIEKAGKADSASIHKALLETVDFEGSCGIVNFDENRNAIKPAVLRIVRDGEFKFLAVVNP